MVTYLENLKDELNYCILNGEEYLKGSIKLKDLGRTIVSNNNKTKSYEVLSNSIIELLNNMEMKSALEVYSLISHMLIILNDKENVMDIDKANEIIPNNMKYEAIPLQKFNENKINNDIRSVGELLNNLTHSSYMRLETSYYQMKKQGLDEIFKQYIMALDLKNCKLYNATDFLKYYGDLQGENSKEILIDIFNNRRVEYRRGALLALSKIPEAKEFVLDHCSDKEYILYREQCKAMMKDKDIAREVFEDLRRDNFVSLFRNTVNIISKELYELIKEAKFSKEMKAGYLSYYNYYRNSNTEPEKLIVEYLKKWGGNSPWLL